MVDAVARVVHLRALPSRLETKVQVSASSQALGDMTTTLGLRVEQLYASGHPRKPLHAQLAKQTPAR